MEEASEEGDASAAYSGDILQESTMSVEEDDADTKDKTAEFEFENDQQARCSHLDQCIYCVYLCLY